MALPSVARMFASVPRFRSVPLQTVVRSFASSTGTTDFGQLKLEHMKVERKDAVYHVQLNQPKKLNAMTFEMWREFKTVFDALSETLDCRAIVLTGNGRSFTAGLDLVKGVGMLIAFTSDPNVDVARKAHAVAKFIRAAQEGFTALESCPKPVIAAIHGHCYGAGIGLITSADIRYSTCDAVFTMKETDLAIASDVGVLQRIQKIVGSDSLTRELAYTSRVFNGSQAKEYGLVSRTFKSSEECFHAAFQIANEIASKSPMAIQGTKRALNYARNHTIEDSLEWMVNWNMSMLMSKDILTVAEAMKKKVEPVFEDF